MCARPPQSWWLAGSRVSRGTAKMAGRWILFQPREIPPSFAIADSSGRQIIWRYRSVSLSLNFNLSFLKTSPLVLSLSLISHLLTPPSNLSPSLFTTLLLSSSSSTLSIHVSLPACSHIGQSWSEVWFLIGAFIWCEKRLNRGWRRRESKRDRG